MENEIKDIQEDKYGTKKMQNYLLSVLLYIDDFCKQYSINYSLSGGSLLGAIRHNGFIPWDDDIDLMFDRENYDKFLKLAKKHFSSDYCIIGNSWVKRVTRVDNPLKDEEEGCIDLFCFDEIPNNQFRKKMKLYLLYLLQGMMKEKIDYARFSLKNKLLLFFTSSFGRLFTKHFKQKRYDQLSIWTGEKNQTHENLNIYNTFFNQIGRTVFYKKDVEEYLYHDFEGKKIMIISGWNHYLTEIYGDFMKLPPEEDRYPKHSKQ